MEATRVHEGIAAPEEMDRINANLLRFSERKLADTKERLALLVNAACVQMGEDYALPMDAAGNVLQDRQMVNGETAREAKFGLPEDNRPENG